MANEKKELEFVAVEGTKWYSVLRESLSPAHRIVPIGMLLYDSGTFPESPYYFYGAGERGYTSAQLKQIALKLDELNSKEGKNG